MNKSIITTPAPTLQGIASPEFIRREFDAATYLKGLEVIIEKALRCPCHLHHPLIDCENCFGTGWFYINPTKTHALITGINQNNQYKTWSEELLGTISVTVTDTDKPNLGFFDKITIKKEYSYFSENLVVRKGGLDLFVFTTYKPTEVISIHRFVSSTEKLVQVTAFQQSTDNPYCTVLENNPNIQEGDVVSVYYKYELQFNVLDFPHIVRASWIKDKSTGQLVRTELPIQAIARQCHLIASEKPNFDGSGVILNDNIEM